MSVPHTNLPKAFLGFSVGRPAALYDYTNPDWIPSLKLGYETGSEVAAAMNRYDRKRARETRKETDHEAIQSNNLDFILPTTLAAVALRLTCICQASFKQTW